MCDTKYRCNFLWKSGSMTQYVWHKKGDRLCHYETIHFTVHGQDCFVKESFWNWLCLKGFLLKIMVIFQRTLIFVTTKKRVFNVRRFIECFAFNFTLTWRPWCIFKGSKEWQKECKWVFSHWLPQSAFFQCLFSEAFYAKIDRRA